MVHNKKKVVTIMNREVNIKVIHNAVDDLSFFPFSSLFERITVSWNIADSIL